MRRIVSIFTTIVYEDGETAIIPIVKTGMDNEVINIDESNIQINDFSSVEEDKKVDIKCNIAKKDEVLFLGEASQKIIQILMVLHFSMKLYNTSSMEEQKDLSSRNRMIDTAINNVSIILDISKASILDKLSRGLKCPDKKNGISTETFRNMTKVFMRDGESLELRNLILDNVSSRAAIKLKDTEIVNKFFDNPLIDFHYDNGSVNLGDRF